MAKFSWHSELGLAPHWYKIYGWLPNRYLPIVMFDSIPIYKPNSKGGHRHNHIYNVCNRILFHSKTGRRIRIENKREWRETFEVQAFGGMNRFCGVQFLDILKKGKLFKQIKNRRSKKNENAYFVAE